MVRNGAGASVTLEAHYDTGTGAKGTGAVTAEFVRKGVGTYDMDLRVTGSTNKPFTPAEVTATWSLPSKDLGPLRMIWREALKYPLPVELVPAGTGHWKAQARLVPTGDWLLVVKVRTTDIDEDSVTFATSNAALDAITKTFTGTMIAVTITMAITTTGTIMAIITANTSMIEIIVSATTIM